MSTTGYGISHTNRAVFSGLLWLLVLVAGCDQDSTKELQPPANVLSRDSMVQVMATIHITESRIMQANDLGLKQDDKSRLLLLSLNKHQVDTSLFNRSFSWYASHPELFSVMYDDIISEISRRQAEAR
jgi:hypothetical protein